MSFYATYSETELFRLTKEGEGEAYTEIYNRFSRVLFLHAYKRLNSADLAMDVVHDVFINLWEKREKLEVTGSLKGYLIVSVRNRIFNLIARQKVQSVYITEFRADYNEGLIHIADYDVRYKEMLGIIEKEIEALPPRMRQVFRLSRDEQFTYRQIASELKISEETVKDQIKKALKILRGKLAVLFLFLFI